MPSGAWVSGVPAFAWLDMARSGLSGGLMSQ